MAYEKQTWQTGDVITAPKLNHMEDGIESAPGYRIESQELVIIPEQTVTTEENYGSIGGELTVADGIEEAPETLTVTFNGQIYECQNNDMSYGAPWDDSLNDGNGGIDWSEYPFFISLIDAVIETESAGTYTVSATTVTENVIVSEGFQKARGYSVDNGTVTVSNDFQAAVRTAQNTPVIYEVQKGWSGNDYYIVTTNGVMMSQATFDDLLPLYVMGRLIIRGCAVLNVYQSGNKYRADLLTYSTNGAKLWNFFSDQADTALHWAEGN